MFERGRKGNSGEWKENKAKKVYSESGRTGIAERAEWEWKENGTKENSLRKERRMVCECRAEGKMLVAAQATREQDQMK